MADGRATNGGARAGAGRKRKADKFETQIQRAEQKIADKLPWLVDQMMELATGVLVEDTGIDGAPFVYQKPPDRQAIVYLMDRIMGKPTERREYNFPKPIEEMTEDELRAILES